MMNNHLIFAIRWSAEQCEEGDRGERCFIKGIFLYTIIIEKYLLVKSLSCNHF